MIVIKNDMTIFFDVDETLVLWNIPKDKEDQTILFDNYGFNTRLLPHYKHIDQLKRHKARGHKVIVWSAGGSSWAEAVVKTLKLEEYVDVVLAKPQFYYDDLKSDQFLPESNRVYFDPKSNLETTNSEIQNKEED